MFRFEFPRYWLYLIAAVVLLALVWSSFQLFGHPYSGITWSYTNGAVITVDEEGPAAGLIHKDDRISAINGVPVYEARNLPNRHIGEVVFFSLEGRQDSVPVRLANPPMRVLGQRLSIIPIAIALWLLGSIVLAYGQVERLVHLFFLFCQMTALILGLGAISSYAPMWSYWLFGLLLWWVGPLTLHTHLALSARARTRFNRVLTFILYSLALLLSLIDINRLRLIIPGPLLTLKYLWIGTFMLASASILISNSIWGSSAENRRRTRIAGISAITALMPFVFFSLIPEALTGQFLLPYEVTFLALLILPLGISYSILLYRLVKIEREINQSAAYALAAFIIFILYAFIYTFFSNSFSFRSNPNSLLAVAILLVLALSAHPAHQALYRWLYQVFYGGWVDDHGAVKRISQDLKHVTGDTYSIAQTLVQTLQRTMLLEYVHLLLSDGRLIKMAKENQLSSETFLPGPTQTGELFAQLQERTGRELGSGEELREFLLVSGADGASVGMEAGSLLGPRAQLWLLFGGRRNWQGLLVLGSKRGRGDIETKDMEILEVVLRQAGAALENERLLEEVRQRSGQIRELNRKARWALEVERKRIARDLHDIVIQTLIGINFKLANIRARNDPENSGDLASIRSDLHESLVELRGICADLRPPALDALGLSPAIEARITELKSQVSFEVHLKSDDLSAYEIHDEVALSIYRFIQEALLNVQKHSNATVALIELQIEQDDLLRCTIEDDGQGFQLPESLEVLVAQQHFGLIGLQEQLETVGGRMLIVSEPGKGCHLTAWVPLHQSIVSAQPDPIKIEEEI